MNKIPKREEHLEAFKLFEGICESDKFTIDSVYEAFKHITPKYIKEYRNNKENKMSLEQDKETKQEDKKEQQELQFLDERVRLDVVDEETLVEEEEE